MDDENNNTIKLSSLLMTIIRNWKVFVLVGLIFGGIFCFYSILKADHYKSKTVVFTNFGNVIKTPYGSFKASSQRVRDYLKILDSEHFRYRGLQVDYSLESQDQSTIQFIMRREKNDSLAYYFEQFIDSFFTSIDLYLKKEARNQFIVKMRNDILRKKNDVKLLNKKIEGLNKLDKTNSPARINKIQFDELRKLGVSFNLNDLLSREHLVYDSLLVSFNMNRSLTKSEIDVLEETEQQLLNTSAKELFPKTSFVNQVTSTYIPPERPHRPVKENVLKKTILGVLTGLLIAFFIVFFNAVVKKSD